MKLLQRARYVDGRDNARPVIVADILAEAGLAEAARRVRSPDADLLAAYRGRVEAGRSEMARFGADGVPALVVGEGAGRRLLRSSALFGGLDALLAQLKAA